VLELYCGIGGCAAALAGLPAATRVVAAIDVDRRALEIYRRNFPHPAPHRTRARTLDSISARELAGYEADLWWLSPPCQPFTRRGLRRDEADPRARSFLALLDRLDDLGPEAPRHLALENVPGFAGSRCHARLLATLERAGYRFREGCLCPSELGVPNRRRRYYLAASRDGEVGDWLPAAGEPPQPGPLASFLDPPDQTARQPELRVDPDLARRYEGALDVVSPEAPAQVTACFTAAYGRSPVRSGSYLRLPDNNLRRFSPQEILRLLGFPESYALPPGLPARKTWPLVGNSLSVPAVRRVLAALPALRVAAS
jgi:site-specific DNA-cytosine methylase